jgi:hypothetical protein
MTEDQKAFEEWYFAGANKKAADKDSHGNYIYMPANINWRAWEAACEYKNTQTRRSK